MSAEKLKQMWGGVDGNVKTWLTGALAGGGIGAVGAGALSAADDRKGENKKDRRTRILRQAVLGGGLGAGIGSLPAGLNMIDSELNNDKTFFDPKELVPDGESSLSHATGTLSPISNTLNRIMNFGDEASSDVTNNVANTAGGGLAAYLGRGLLMNTGGGDKLSLRNMLSKQKNSGLVNMLTDIISQKKKSQSVTGTLSYLNDLRKGITDNKTGGKLNLQHLIQTPTGGSKPGIIDALRKQLSIDKNGKGGGTKFRNVLAASGIDVSNKGNLEKLLRGTSMENRVSSGNALTRSLGKLRGIGARGRMGGTDYAIQLGSRLGLPALSGFGAKKSIQGAGTLAEEAAAQFTPGGHPQLTRFAIGHHRASITKAIERIKERSQAGGVSDYKPTSEDIYKELQSSNLPEKSRPNLELIKNLLSNSWDGKEDDNAKDFQKAILEGRGERLWDK